MIHSVQRSASRGDDSRRRVHRQARRHPHRNTQGSWQTRLRAFAAEYGWWRVVAIPVLVVLTVWVLADVVRGDTGATGDNGGLVAEEKERAGQDNASPDRGNGPDPADIAPADEDTYAAAREQLPAGGEFSDEGDDTYRPAGTPGLDVGEGTEQTVRYSVEIENGVDTAAYGGDDAVATLIDATLSDPRGWTADESFKFVHVAPDEEPDTRFRLTSFKTTGELCGEQLETETSCHTTITGESVVVLNEARWVRGATPFEGDIGNYRQYLINHEFGHAIGYNAHRPCGGDGKLAPVMMQQTISLSNSRLHRDSESEIYPDDGAVCQTNPWPYPQPGASGDANPHQP